MKILWFSNTPASGEYYIGDKVIRGGWLKSLDKELKNHVDLHVAFNYPKYFEDFEYKNVNYYPICFKNWKLQLSKDLFFSPLNENKRIQKYLEVIEKVKPDLIHIHGSESNYIQVQKHTQIPIVLSIQGNNNGYIRKYTSSLDLNDLSYVPYRINKGLKWNLMLKNLKKEYFKIIKNTIVERENLHSIKYVIGRTEWDRRITRVLAPKSTYYHNDEIIRDSFYNNEWNPSSKSEFIIHTTGGVNTYKGIFTICETVNELNKLDIKFIWKIFGLNNEDQIVEIIKKKMGNTFPEKNIYFMGPVSENELMINLKNCHLFVQSSHIENSPNSLCEAMLMGVPCIATLAGGTGSLLTDKKEGILIQDGDPFSLAGAILELKQNYNLAIKYGLSARERALKRHNKNKIVSDLVSIYEQILSLK
jgi:glycosyltransferase involved in cell wall biosynthesis